MEGLVTIGHYCHNYSRVKSNVTHEEHRVVLPTRRENQITLIKNKKMKVTKNKDYIFNHRNSGGCGDT